ncbi:hypothetical protein DSO57_1024380 [Entomophthora muscae]|uniref:Uncharacterized protein n=1 Tax=Entomophthora muscae TaxID=34485 RepID=A0ACC2RTQ6_9FUNG|nr:hypothetical protein DSO57_1024380 [Entomophthora muscae]
MDNFTSNPFKICDTCCFPLDARLWQLDAQQASIPLPLVQYLQQPIGVCRVWLQVVTSFFVRGFTFSFVPVCSVTQSGRWQQTSQTQERAVEQQTPVSQDPSNNYENEKDRDKEDKVEENPDYQEGNP